MFVDPTGLVQESMGIGGGYDDTGYIEIIKDGINKRITFIREYNTAIIMSSGVSNEQAGLSFDVITLAAFSGAKWSSVIAGAGSLAKIGDDFGKLGKLVENPGIKADWANTSTHGLERMAERGVTQSMVNSWVQSGKVLQQSSGNYLYITKDGAAVLNNAGKLITHIRVQNLIQQCGTLLKNSLEIRRLSNGKSSRGNNQ